MKTRGVYLRHKVYIRYPQGLYSIRCGHGRDLPPDTGIFAAGG